jgi:hypothetical protein
MSNPLIIQTSKNPNKNTTAKPFANLEEFQKEIQLHGVDQVKEGIERALFKCSFPPCPEEGKGLKALQICSKVRFISFGFKLEQLICSVKCKISRYCSRQVGGHTFYEIYAANTSFSEVSA